VSPCRAGGLLKDATQLKKQASKKGLLLILETINYSLTHISNIIYICMLFLGSSQEMESD
jgi:hypothetical protein